MPAYAVLLKKVVTAVSQISIPIFPLKTVLFPGTLVRLQVVETRYRALVDAAVSRYQRCFGVAFTREGEGSAESVFAPDWRKNVAAGLSPVGTMAQILHLTREKNAHVNVIAVGKERFRVVSLDPSGAYPVAVVEDAPLRAVASPQVHALERQARTIATEYFSLLLNLSEGDSERLKLPAAAVPLANFIAANVQISLDRRQHLLEFNELETLLGEEIQLLERELTRIQWFEAQKHLRPKGPAPFSLN